MFLELFVLDLWANTCQTHDIAILTFDLAGVYHGDTGLRPPSVHQGWSSYRPFHSTDITHFGLNIMSAWRPLPLTLKLVFIIAREVGNLPTNFGVSRTFRSRLIGQHVSDASRDFATLTFDFGGHGTCRWYGSSCSICVPTLKFVGLPVRKILGIYCVNFNPPGEQVTK